MIKVKLKELMPVKKRQVKPKFKEGMWVDNYYCGEELTIDDLEEMIGELVIVDYSTYAHPWHKVVRVVEVAPDGNLKRLVYNDGTKSHGSISSSFLGDEVIPAYSKVYVWRLNRKGGKYDSNRA